MMKCTVNDARLKRSLDAVRKGARGEWLRRAKPILVDAGLDLERESARRAPVDEGTLRRSRVSEVEVEPARLSLTVTFGGEAEAYAQAQHEGENFEHPRGGQAFYLYGRDSSAWNPTSQRNLCDRMADALARIVEESIR